IRPQRQASRCFQDRNTADWAQTKRLRNARSPGPPEGLTDSPYRQACRYQTAFAVTAAPPATDRSRSRRGRQSQDPEVEHDLWKLFVLSDLVILRHWAQAALQSGQLNQSVVVW